MLRMLSVALFLGLAACSGGSKPDVADPNGGGGAGTGEDPGPDPKSSAPCCCETYDLETPNITYSVMSQADCASQEGRCEDSNEYCEGA